MNIVEGARRVATPDRLSALSTLLEDMAFVINTDNAFAPSSRQQQVEHCLAIGFCATLLNLFAITAWYRVTSDILLQGVPMLLLGSFTTWLVIAIAYSIVLLIGMALALRQHRGSHSVDLQDRFGDEASLEAGFIAKLLTFDKTTLASGLRLYQRRWGIFDVELSVFIHNLRKLALFPALIAAMIAATPLLQGESHFFLWGGICLISCGYVVVFYVGGRRERPELVMALVEYALSYEAQAVKTTSPQMSLHRQFR